MKNKFWYVCVGIFSSLVYLLAVVYAVVFFGMARGNFFDSIIEKRQLEMHLEIDAEELEQVMDRLMAYVKCWDETDSPQMKVVVAGVEADFYTEEELVHLADVQRLMEGMSKVFLALTFTAILGTVYLWKKKQLKNMALGYFVALGLIVACGISIGLIMLQGTQEFIQWFHHIFFPQGGWMFHSAYSRIVWFFPNMLYEKALLFACGWLVSVVILFTTLSVWIWKKK